MSGKPTFGSLFAGIGGIDLGLERAGWECRWQVENDEFCAKVLERRWPDVRRYGDVRKLEPRDLEAVDLICGGFPCQPVSVAGKRTGEDDPRWLWPQFRRFIRSLTPRWVLAENVPGLLSINSGRVFGDILRDLAQGGYDTEWNCVPASLFGAPHVRDRVFIIAWRIQADVPITSANQGGGNADHVAYALNERRLVRRPEASGSEGEYRTGGAGLFPTGGLGKGAFGAWLPEPSVGRVANGLPDRLDRTYRAERLKGLGNAVVPQVAEWLGRRIIGCHLEIHG